MAQPLRILVYFIACALTLWSFCTHALAQSSQAITSSAHLGMGVIGDSSTGFKNSAGSVLFFDITRRFGSKLDIGLRSLGEGARMSTGEFYRIGSGPLISFLLNEHWSIQMALQIFSETGLDAHGDKAYDSRGRALMLGWERHIDINPYVVFSWGGFIKGHQGGFHPNANIASLGNQQHLAKTNANIGTTRGLEIAFKMKL